MASSVGLRPLPHVPTGARVRHMSEPSAGTTAFSAARDLLLELREDQPAARERFRWPRPDRFNYARNWFDVVAAGPDGDRPALWIVEPDGSQARLSYAELAARSRRLAAWLAERGV